MRKVKSLLLRGAPGIGVSLVPSAHAPQASVHDTPDMPIVEAGPNVHLIAPAASVNATEVSGTPPAGTLPPDTSYVARFVVPPAPKHGSAVAAVGVTEFEMKANLNVSVPR